MKEVFSVLARNLHRCLTPLESRLDSEGWKTHIFERLTYSQQQVVARAGIKRIDQMDLASILRIFDQNWFELSKSFQLGPQERSWLKELQQVRNRWAHLPVSGLSKSDTFRDIDTTLRFLIAINTAEEDLAIIQRKRKENYPDVDLNNTDVDGDPSGKVLGTSENGVSSESSNSEDLSNNVLPLGSLIALRSDPRVSGVITNVSETSPDCKYSVFIRDGIIREFFHSQVTLVKREEKTANDSVEDLQVALSALAIQSPSNDHLYSLRSSRIDFVPHQFRPVLKLIKSDRPRLLIADEVGVGKTIEAGLILKELQARRDIQSVLVICPKSLIVERKWRDELKRFDEDFIEMNGRDLSYCIDQYDKEGRWPRNFRKAILPYSLLTEDLLFGPKNSRHTRKGLIELDPAPIFDLLILDEAHNIRNRDTWSYRNCRFFCDCAEAVLQLTATPVQLGNDDFFTLLQLLRPDLLPSSREFELMLEPNSFINMAIEECRGAREGWQEKCNAHFEDALKTTWGTRVLRSTPNAQKIKDLISTSQILDKDRIKVINYLEDSYTFSSFVNRTRRRDIGQFTIRRAHCISIDFLEEHKAFHDNVLKTLKRMYQKFQGNNSVIFALSMIRRQMSSCIFGLKPYLEKIVSGKLTGLELIDSDSDVGQEEFFGALRCIQPDLIRLLEDAESLSKEDPKYEALRNVIFDKSKTSNPRVLLFSSFLHTLSYLKGRLQYDGFRVGLITGEVSDEDRRYTRSQFQRDSQDPESIDILLSSEVGCEGLDYQFCDFLANYDLPWNPMRLEQRIGRIDRYGQKSESIEILNFITPGTIDFEIYHRCLDRIGVFQRSIGGSEEILGEISKQLRQIVANQSLSPEEILLRLQQLQDNEIRRISEIEALEVQQANLLGLSVPVQDSENVAKHSTIWVEPTQLQRLVNTYFLSVGAENLKLDLTKKILTMAMSQEAKHRVDQDSITYLGRDKLPVAWDDFIRGPDKFWRFTYDQAMADLDRTLDFITPVHPISKIASASLRTPKILNVDIEMASDHVEIGTYEFCVYHWEYRGLATRTQFVVISASDEIEDILLQQLSHSVDVSANNKAKNVAYSKLEDKHYSHWVTARANFITEVESELLAKKNSLSATHHARVSWLQEQISNAREIKITRMREAQYFAAERDYQKRVREINEIAGKVDILTTLISRGTLLVKPKEKSR
jgi:ATP-dependent helicase HepA